MATQHSPNGAPGTSRRFDNCNIQGILQWLVTVPLNGGSPREKLETTKTMKFFNGLVIGIIIGAAAWWFMQDKARQHPEAEQRFKESADQAGAAATEAAHHLSDAFKAKLETLDLRADEIKAEMAKTGKIVRRKAQEIGSHAEDAAADARIDAAIKAKYAADSDLSVWSISVSSHQGHVALSGTVPNPEGVGKAITLALEVDGVEDVTSTLEIKPKE
jgi:gas vesicle protein